MVEENLMTTRPGLRLLGRFHGVRRWSNFHPNHIGVDEDDYIKHAVVVVRADWGVSPVKWSMCAVV